MGNLNRAVTDRRQAADGPRSGAEERRPGGDGPSAREDVHVVVARTGARARVTVMGQLSDEGARGLRVRLDDLVGRGAHTVVLDLEQCRSLGPATLDTLALATAALRERDASLVVSGVSPSVIHRLADAGLAGQLTIGRLPAGVETR
jgi:anti-anti-sigma regulatory factor